MIDQDKGLTHHEDVIEIDSDEVIDDRSPEEKAAEDLLSSLGSETFTDMDLDDGLALMDSFKNAAADISDDSGDRLTRIKGDLIRVIKDMEGAFVDKAIARVDEIKDRYATNAILSETGAEQNVAKLRVALLRLNQALKMQETFSFDDVFNVRARDIMQNNIYILEDKIDYLK